MQSEGGKSEPRYNVSKTDTPFLIPLLNNVIKLNFNYLSLFPTIWRNSNFLISPTAMLSSVYMSKAS